MLQPVGTICLWTSCPSTKVTTFSRGLPGQLFGGMEEPNVRSIQVTKIKKIIFYAINILMLGFQIFSLIYDEELDAIRCITENCFTPSISDD